jgi:drug/metabolite transporter (DMT)-like permease
MTSNSHKHLSPFLVLFLGIFAVSTSSVFIRLAQREAPSLAIATYRLSIASLILLPFVWKKRGELKNLNHGQWLLLILSGVFLAVHFAAWISSLAYTSVASSVVFVCTTPLWVALLSPIFLGEKLDARIWLGLLIALTGGILVGMNDVCELGIQGFTCHNLERFYQGNASLGNFLAVIGAWMAAGYMLIGRKVRPALSLTGYIGTVYPFAAVFLIIMALGSGTRVGGFSVETWVWFAALALIPQLVGHTSYNYALGYLLAAFVAVAVLAEPIGSSLLAVITLNEIPTAVEILGGVIILAGIGIASWMKK